MKNKKTLLALLLLGASISAAPTLRITSENGIARFAVSDETSAAVSIQPAFVDKSIRSVEPEKLYRMLLKGDGYLRVTKNDHDEYGLQCRVRGNGGGPILGQVAKWTVRGVGYGGIAAVSFVWPGALATGSWVVPAIESAARTAEIAGTIYPSP